MLAVQQIMSYLEVRNLHKRFGDFTALGDISLDIAEGEFVCFLGPSGCGKTTLLRAIAGLDPQTSGTIRQKGRDVSALPPSARDFGIVFQSFHLIPTMTALENVAVPLELAGNGDAFRLAREELAQVGLSERLNHYPAQLSGGEQQRVALARALAPRPRLLPTQPRLWPKRPASPSSKRVPQRACWRPRSRRCSTGCSTSPIPKCAR